MKDKPDQNKIECRFWIITARKDLVIESIQYEVWNSHMIDINIDKVYNEKFYSWHYGTKNKT